MTRRWLPWTARTYCGAQLQPPTLAAVAVVVVVVVVACRQADPHASLLCAGVRECVRFKFGASGNAELRLRWAQLVVKQEYVGLPHPPPCLRRPWLAPDPSRPSRARPCCRWAPGFESVVGFLKWQGKIRYTVPVYRMLVNGSECVACGV